MEIEIYKNLSLENLPNEEWKDVVGYEGSYMCSNLGRIMSLKTNRILKPIKRPDGYLGVSLRKDGETQIFLIHRLICDTFIQNPYNLPITNHKNEIKTDNRADNLEHCDYSYNNTYGSRVGLQTRTLSKPVCQYSLDGKLIATYESVTEAAKRDRSYATNINRVCCGIRATANGFVWRYLGDNFYLKERNNRVQICQYSKNGDFIKEYDSIRSASKECGISEDGIGNCCAGRSKSSGGFIWKYKEQSLNN